MKRKLLTLTAVSTALFLIGQGTKAQAQDATGALITALGGAGGYAIGKAFEKDWQYAPAVGAAILPALANWGYGIFKRKSDEDRIKYYISGRNYERWIQSQQIWYQSTLDPHTGRPPAFSGLSAMDDGMPQTSSKGQQDKGITQVFTVPVRLPAGTYGGVPFTERVGEFPKLP